MSDTCNLVFFGVEITPEEAVGLLREAFVLCATVGGSSTTAQLALSQDRARAMQLRLFGMIEEPGRVRVQCATCGQTRDDVATVPLGDAGYVRAAATALEGKV